MNMNKPKMVKFTCANCRQHLEADSDMAGTDFDCPACGKQNTIPNLSEVRIRKPTTRNVRLALRRCFLVYAATVFLYFTVPFHLILPFKESPIAELWDRWETRDFEKWWKTSTDQINEKTSKYIANEIERLKEYVKKYRELNRGRLPPETPRPDFFNLILRGEWIPPPSSLDATGNIKPSYHEALNGLYGRNIREFMAENGRGYWSFLPYVVAKISIPIALLLGIPIIVYFAVLWIIKGLKEDGKPTS